MPAASMYIGTPIYSNICTGRIYYHEGLFLVKSNELVFISGVCHIRKVVKMTNLIIFITISNNIGALIYMCCAFLITNYIRRKPLGEVKGQCIFSWASVTMGSDKNQSCTQVNYFLYITALLFFILACIYCNIVFIPTLGISKWFYPNLIRQNHLDRPIIYIG